MKQKTLLIIISIIILVGIFFPKPYIRGGLGGFIGPGQSAYKEEYSCFGLKQSYYPIYGCADCGKNYNCYGIPYNKKCYTEKFNQSITKEITACK